MKNYCEVSNKKIMHKKTLKLYTIPNTNYTAKKEKKAKNRQHS